MHELYFILHFPSNLLKATFSFVMPVRLSFRMEQLSSHWTVFHEIWELSIFRKSVLEIQALLMSERITDTLHEDLCTFMISRWILLIMRNFSEKSCGENRNTFMFHNFFRSSCLLWDNVEKYSTARQTTDDLIRLLLIARWLTKATRHTHCFSHCNNSYRGFAASV
jgi:hypothetical protein